MRALLEDNELSYESFVETFSSISRPIADRSNENDFISHSISAGEDDVSVNNETNSIKSVESNCFNYEPALENDSIQIGGDVGKPQSSNAFVGRRKRLRKISIDRITSFGDVVQAAMTSRKSKSDGRDDHSSAQSPGEARRMSTFLNNIHPYLARKFVSESDSASTDGEGGSSGSISSKSSSPISKAAVFRIPATRLSAAAHRGYLDCRNKKKQWERFWCVLQDTCLYCYNTPQSEVTRDALLLRGYDVVADVTNLNRTRFAFRLQQQGVPTLHFASDNHRDFLLWVGTLERETRKVAAHRNHNKSTTTDDESKPAPNVKVHRASMPALSPTLSSPSEKILKRSSSQETFDIELVKMQRQKLLREISTQRQQIIEEQFLLEKVENNASSSDGSSQSVTRRLSRDEVIDYYEKAKEDEELKVTKFLTLLNRRRNSVQLKADQCSKDLAPKSGRRRRDNHFQFSSMESRLKEMQESLAQIDKEFEEEEANKLHNLEKLQQKRDLELLILDQRETLNIMRRHKAKGMSHRRRYSLNDPMSPSSTRSAITLGSIDELSSISDERMSSSTSASSASDANMLPSTMNNPPMRSISTPLNNRRIFYEGPSHKPPSTATKNIPEDITRRISVDGNSDADSGFQPSSNLLEELVSGSTEETPKLSETCGLPPMPSADIVPGTRAPHSDGTVFKNAPPSSAKVDDIDSSVLAQIEDFQQFAKRKLEEKRIAS